MAHQIFDGGDGIYTIKTTTGEYTFLNPSNKDDKINDFF